MFPSGNEFLVVFSLEEGEGRRRNSTALVATQRVVTPPQPTERGAPMEPHRVDEFMRAAWGHIYTQKDAEDHVKRTKQMLAKAGDADSSVDNALKVEQSGALATNGV